MHFDALLNDIVREKSSPKILKMPKPPRKADDSDNHGTQRLSAPVSKMTAMAEIILFPNGPNEIPFLPGFQTDPDAKTRWLRLADDALDGKPNRKKA